MLTIKIMLFIFFCLETMIGAYLYVNGAHGVYAVYELHNECAEIKKKSDTLIQENQKLQNELDDWNTYPAYREIYARTHLQLATNEGEIWYRY